MKRSREGKEERKIAWVGIGFKANDKTEKLNEEPTIRHSEWAGMMCVSVSVSVCVCVALIIVNRFEGVGRNRTSRITKAG